MTGVHDQADRLALRLGDGGDELVIELRSGDAVETEELAPSASLERGADGIPLRIRLKGLTERRTTNAMIAPMVRCGEQEPLVGPSGAACYWLCLFPGEREDRVFRPHSPGQPEPEA